MLLVIIAVNQLLRKGGNFVFTLGLWVLYSPAESEKHLLTGLYKACLLYLLQMPVACLS